MRFQDSSSDEEEVEEEEEKKEEQSNVTAQTTEWEQLGLKLIQLKSFKQVKNPQTLENNNNMKRQVFVFHNIIDYSIIENTK